MNILKVLTARRIHGNFGERAALKYLKRQGYDILETNYVAESGEVDIIAKDRDSVVFVEVKTRSYRAPSPTTARPAAAVTKEKQRRIIACAAEYGHSHYGLRRIRFDVIEVYTLESNGVRKVKDIKHIVAAFDKSSAHR